MHAYNLTTAFIQPTPIHRTPASITARTSRVRPTIAPSPRAPNPTHQPTHVCLNRPHAQPRPKGNPLPPAAQPARTAGQTIRLGRLHARVSPRVLLFLVPCIWASFIICAKLLYTLPRALRPETFNTLRLLLSCCFFIPVLSREARALRADRAHARHVLPGLELGFLVFSANVLQIVGLKYTQASRAAFLNQLSTILVPVLAAVFGLEEIRSRHLVGALAALLGIAFLTIPIALAAAPAAAIPTGSLSTRLGDAIEILSAFFTSAYVLRMAFHARSVDACRLVPLAAIKVAAQAVMSFVLLAVTALMARLRDWIPAMLASMQGLSTSRTQFKKIAVTTVSAWTPSAILCNAFLIFWAGVMVSAGTAWLQTKGQAGVSAGETAVLFAFQPVWASLFAVIFLGERMGVAAMLGASLVVSGALIAGSNPSKVEKGVGTT